MMHNLYNKFAFYFGLLMSAFYIFAGIYIAFINSSVMNLNRYTALSLGILMSAYGIFRGYRYLKIRKEDKHES